MVIVIMDIIETKIVSKHCNQRYAKKLKNLQERNTCLNSCNLQTLVMKMQNKNPKYTNNQDRD